MGKPRARTVRPGRRAAERRASLPILAIRGRKRVVGLAPYLDGGDKQYTLVLEWKTNYNKPSFV
ncbi:hypothetical protein [Paenibacillus sp. YYML68]|uniref:hypothetical protein n=1 Tax=Paenibacillus sp. YYML68 TaxID=2909250 RepID=UPI0024934977|nr:hypothetical protein [Paenibacillus sp. YYML68]